MNLSSELAQDSVLRAISIMMFDSQSRGDCRHKQSSYQKELHFTHEVQRFRAVGGIAATLRVTSLPARLIQNGSAGSFTLQGVPTVN